MMNQNLSNQTEQSQNASTLSGSVQKPYTSKLLIQKKDEYLEAFRSHRIKVLLQKKRLTAIKGLSNKDKLGQGLSLQEFIAECEKRTYTLEQINELVTSISSPSLHRQYFGVIGIRKLLATRNPPIQPFIDAGVLPRLVEFLGREDEPQLQAEAAWTLSNLSSGTTEQTQKIIENGAIPALIKLLGSPHHDVRFKALWPLGNFAGDSAVFRDLILQGGAIAPLVEILDKAINEGDKFMVRDASWDLANIVKTKPNPPFEAIKDTLAIFAKVIMSQEDPEILGNAVWCISHLSTGGKEERIQEVIDTGVVPYIVKCMDKSDLSLLVGSLRTIGNICLGNHEQVDILLKIPGIMEKLFSALANKKKAIRMDATLVIANVMTGTPDHLQYIVGNPEYLDQLLHFGRNDTSNVRKEVAIALKNALSCANLEQMRILLEEKEILGFLEGSLKKQIVKRLRWKQYTIF